MIYMPLKFFPWIFIAVGIGLLCIGEQIAWAIILLIIGLTWAGFQVAGMINKSKAKQAASSGRASYTQAASQPANAQPSSQIYTQPSQPVDPQPSPQAYVQPQQPVYAQPVSQPASRCPRCQNADVKGAVFCGKCGYRLK